MQPGMMQKADKGEAMKKILFVCTGNTCRSPMAEGIFNHICRNENLPFTAESAGICTLTGLPVSENSVCALEEVGIDISKVTATSIEDINFDDYALVAVMTEEHKMILCSYGVPAEKIYVLAEETGGISDPYGGSQGIYRKCREEIEEAVKILTERLREEI